jgi:hypothetical protein
MKELAMEDIPKWDVALESLIKDEYVRLGRPLKMQDFKQIGSEYKIRFDDIMHTLCQLVTHNMWRQTGTDEQGSAVSDDRLADLFVYNRLDEEIAEQYAVEWQPHPGVYDSLA